MPSFLQIVRQENRDRDPGMPVFRFVSLFGMVSVFLTFMIGVFLELPPPERQVLFEWPEYLSETKELSEGVMVIDILADGSVRIAGEVSEGSESSDLTALRSYLVTIRSRVNRRGGGAVISPAPEVNFQRLIDVITAVQSAGILHYYFS